MKQIKKLISVFLIIALFVPANSVSAYYTGEVEESVYDERYVTAIETLYGIGIIDEVKPEKYDENVTYETFVKYVKALTGGRAYVDTSEKGKQDITLLNAVEMIIDVSENKIRVEHFGGDSTAYLSVARELGITHGLSSMKPYDKLSYAAVIQMLYNSMRTPVGQHTYITGEGGMSYEYDEEQTILSEYLDIKIKSGFVTADSFWSLNPGTSINEKSIVINGEAYTLKNELTKEYVGYYVDFYYSVEDEHILAIEKDRDTEQIVLNSSDIIDFRDNTYSHDEEGKTKKYRLADNVYIISNYEANMNVNVDMYPANSDIILVDSDDDSRYDVVFIKTYTNIEVQGINKETERLVATPSGSYILPDENPAKVYLNGKLVGYDGIKQGMCASLVVNSKNECREIYLSDKKVTGTVTAINSMDEKTIVTIDGAEYIVAGDTLNPDVFKLSSTGTYMLNFKNEIVGADIEINQEGEGFAYLFRIFKDDSGLEDEIGMKLFMPDGSMKAFYLTEKCRLNGVKPTDMYVEFTSGGQTTQQLVYYKTNSKGKISQIQTAVPASAVNFNEHELHISCYAASDNKSQYSANSFANKILKNEDTVVFNVPENYSDDKNQFYIGSVPDQTEQSFTAFNFEKNAPIADAVVIHRDSASVRRDGVCGGPGINFKTDSSMCIVTDVRQAWVEHYDEVLTEIEFINTGDGKTYEKILADNASWIAICSNFLGGKEVEYYGTADNKMPFDLDEGDLFQYALNLRDELGTINKIYDNSEKSLTYGRRIADKYQDFDYRDISKFGSFYAKYRVSTGFPVAATNEALTISKTTPGSINTFDRSDLEIYAPYKYTKVYNVDLTGRSPQVTQMSLGEILPAYDTDTRLILHTSYVQLKSVVVFEY